MSDTAVRRAELIVGTIARTAVENEKYFCDLDAVAGDGDFGYSLARGFENVISGWDELEYEDAGGLLKKTAIILTKRIGGTTCCSRFAGGMCCASTRQEGRFAAERTPLRGGSRVSPARDQLSGGVGGQTNFVGA